MRNFIFFIINISAFFITTDQLILMNYFWHYCDAFRSFIVKYRYLFDVRFNVDDCMSTQYDRKERKRVLFDGIVGTACNSSLIYDWSFNLITPITCARSRTVFLSRYIETTWIVHWIFIAQCLCLVYFISLIVTQYKVSLLNHHSPFHYWNEKFRIDSIMLFLNEENLNIFTDS